MTFGRQELEMPGKTTQAHPARNICVPVNHSVATGRHGLPAISAAAGNDAF